MKPATCLILLLLTGTTSWAQSPQGWRDQPMRAHELLSNCEAMPRSPAQFDTLPKPQAMALIQCSFFVYGVLEGVSLAGSGKSPCVPASVRLLEIVDHFVRYGRLHREELDGPAAEVLLKALRVSFPCPK